MVELEPELLILRHVDRDELAQAIDEGLRAYGPALAGFIRRLVGNDADADDVFSAFCVDLCTGVGQFRSEASFRTWAYRLAHNACCRFHRDPAARRRVPLSDAPWVADIEARARTSTAPYRRTDVKDRFARLRDKLPRDDLALVILRIDRDLGWEEIARVMLPDLPASDAVLRKKVVALRQQWKRVVDRLRGLAEADGLLAGD